MHCGGISDNILKGIDCEDFYITPKPTVTALFFCKGKNSVISRPMDVWFLSFLVAFVSICERQQQVIFCSLSFPSSTSTLPRALHNEGDRPKRGGWHSGRCFQLFSFSINNCICWKGEGGPDVETVPQRAVAWLLSCNARHWGIRPTKILIMKILGPILSSKYSVLLPFKVNSVRCPSLDQKSTKSVAG